MKGQTYLPESGAGTGMGECESAAWAGSFGVQWAISYCCRAPLGGGIHADRKREGGSCGPYSGTQASHSAQYSQAPGCMGERQGGNAERILENLRLGGHCGCSPKSSEERANGRHGQGVGVGVDPVACETKTTVNENPDGWDLPWLDRAWKWKEVSVYHYWHPFEEKQAQ